MRADRGAAIVNKRLLTLEGTARLSRRRVLERHVLRRLRRLLVDCASDPAVDFDLAGVRLRAPLSHELPYYRAHFPCYSQNLADVAAAVKSKRPGPIIDIGANIGDSAAIMLERVPDAIILCIEGDPEFARYLVANTSQWTGVTTAAPVLLGAESLRRTGELVSGGGTARVDDHTTSLADFVTLDDLLRSDPKFASPSLIKSDTDGYEAIVLRGAAATLSECQPVLFLEYDPLLLESAGSDSMEMLQFLRCHGYERITYFDNYGRFLAQCSLHDQQLVRHFDNYVTGHCGAFPYFDVVLTNAEDASILEAVVPAQTNG